MTTIHLGGKLGQVFGKRWELQVSSPAEAVHAIDVNTKGAFKQYLMEGGHKRCYKVAVGKRTSLLDAKELRNRSGQNTIYITPAIKGAGSGVGKIIAGVILVIVGVLLYEYGGGYIAAAGVVLILGGASLILGGIEQLLTPVPKKTQQLQSYNFQGNAVSVNQGVCVPLIYGRCLVTPIPVCINFDSADTQATANTSLGTVDTIPLIGGGYQYVPGDTSSTSNASS